MNPEFLLSAIIFVPTIGALLLALLFDSKNSEAMRLFAMATTLVTFGLTLMLWGDFQEGTSGIQFEVAKQWIPTWNVYYRLGVDGISLPLVLLTGLVSALAMGASWSITKHVKGYLVLFLMLESGMMGVFLSLDFFLFYVFWEVMLLPMYFLIGVWGGPRKEYAAIKFFLYTLAGSVLMLVAMLMFYFNAPEPGGRFNLIYLADAASKGGLLSPSLQITAFVMLFIGFLTLTSKHQRRSV
jgi:NADH-quinone oxidoreductase subunit M